MLRKYPCPYVAESDGRVQRAVAVERLFPAGSIAFEIYGGGVSDDLFPAERKWTSQAVEKRVREFAGGRLCARAALVRLGHEPVPLLPGRDRAPVWPTGVVGSITHTGDYCVAVVGREERFSAIGIDAERVGRLHPELWPVVLRAEELRRLMPLHDREQRQIATTIFSAKEAFYKCQHYLTNSLLDFKDVLVNISGDTLELSVIENENQLECLRGSWVGRFFVADATVVTGIAVEAHCARRQL